MKITIRLSEEQAHQIMHLWLLRDDNHWEFLEEKNPEIAKRVFRQAALEVLSHYTVPDYGNKTASKSAQK